MDKPRRAPLQFSRISFPLLFSRRNHLLFFVSHRLLSCLINLCFMQCRLPIVVSQTRICSSFQQHVDYFSLPNCTRSHQRCRVPRFCSRVHVALRTSSPTISSRTLFFHSWTRSVKASTRSVRYLESWSISQNLSPTTVSVSPRFQFARNDRRTFGTALPPRTGRRRILFVSSTRTLGGDSNPSTPFAIRSSYIENVWE